jgi:hypothetical protein
MSGAWGRNNNTNNRNDTKSSVTSGSGLASSLPAPSDMGNRRTNESEGGGWAARGAANSSSAPAPSTYRPPQRSEGGSGASWAATTTNYARKQRQDDPSDDVEDKWSNAFKGSSRPAVGGGRDSGAPQGSSQPLAVNSRAVKGFGESSERASGDRPPVERGGWGDRGGDRGDRGGERGPPLEQRQPREPWGPRSGGEERREGGEGEEGGRRFAGRSSGEDRPPREFRGGEPREFGGERREFRGEPRGEPRESRGEPREPREGGGGAYRPPSFRDGGNERRGFGNGDARNEGRGGGGGGDRGGYRGGDRGGRGGDRGGDREWENDPRFAGKFGREMNPRYNNDRGGDRRGGGGDRGGGPDSSSWDAPLPTAPKASLDGGKVNNASSASPIPIFKEKVVPPKAPKNEKKQEDETTTDGKTEKQKKAEKRKQEEETRKAKIEAENAAKEEKQNRHSSSYSAVIDSIKSGLKGKALTEQVKATLGEENSLSPDGVLKAILHSLNEEDYITKWYDQATYGNILAASSNKTTKDELALLYTIQEYCHSKKFPKIEMKGGSSKKLIELLITNLLVGEFVDVEGIIAWADDENDDDIPGRADAIIQTTGMVATLRSSLVDEESEVDSDEDFDAPQAHL